MPARSWPSSRSWRPFQRCICLRVIRIYGVKPIYYLFNYNFIALLSDSKARQSTKITKLSVLLHYMVSGKPSIWHAVVDIYSLRCCKWIGFSINKTPKVATSIKPSSLRLCLLSFLVFIGPLLRVRLDLPTSARASIPRSERLCQRSVFCRTNSESIVFSLFFRVYFFIL